MKLLLKNTFLVLLFMLLGLSATAQKFTSHAVKSGETLESIAKQYRVTPFDILKYNKEIKAGHKLLTNTILVVPNVGTKQRNAAVDNGGNKEEPKIIQEKPIGFATYKVKKRETLYGIAKRFHITEADIKKYNPVLYSAQLKKKMKLRIPKYRRVEPSKEGSRDIDLETYIVSKQETRWSIAHKYGITVDSMLAINPNLSKDNDYLREGQELRMPKMLGSTIEEQITQLYVSYTVPAKMTMYSLSKKYNIKPEEIVRLNPEITEHNGLKEGMVIRVPETKIDTEAINTDNYIFYEVKPKQTEFALTRKLGISYKELLALNPALKDGLKAGMVLKLAKNQTGSFEVKNALILDKINLLDSIDTNNRPKIMFMLPFYVNRLDLNDVTNVAKTIDKSSNIKLSLGFYSGALVALDSIASLGVSVDVNTFDNEKSLDKTKEILLKESLPGYDAIIGPLDVKSLQEVALHAERYQIPVVAPISAKSDFRSNNVFFSYTSKNILRKKMLQYVEGNYTNQNIIIIADHKNLTAKDSILAKFPNAKIVAVKEEAKNIGINRAKLGRLMQIEAENWVFVEIEDFKLMTSVISILNSFQGASLDEEQNEDKLKVRMLTTYKNKAFENEVISSSHLSNLNFTYPSVYREIKNDAFVRRYKKRFKDTPDRYAARGFDLTFDLLLKLAYNKNLIKASQVIGETEYTGNKFSYEKQFSSGFYNQSSYIMMYENMRIKEAREQEPEQL